MYLREEPLVRAVDGAHEDAGEGVDEIVLAHGLTQHELLVEGALDHPAQDERGGARLLANRGAAGGLQRLDARGRRVDEAVEDRVPEDGDLVVGRGGLDDRAQHRAVLAVDRRDVAQRVVQVLGRVAGAREPEVALAVELVDDVLGQAQQELALVAEVEVERGARDPGAGRDALDVEVGVGDALVEQPLGRLEHCRLHRGTLRRRCAARLAPHRHAINVMDGAPDVLWHRSHTGQRFLTVAQKGARGRRGEAPAAGGEEEKRPRSTRTVTRGPAEPRGRPRPLHTPQAKGRHRATANGRRGPPSGARRAPSRLIGADRRMKRAPGGYTPVHSSRYRRSLGPGMMPGPRRVRGPDLGQRTTVTRRVSRVPLPLASLTSTCAVSVRRRLRRSAVFARRVNFARTRTGPAVERRAAPVATTTGDVRASSPTRRAVPRSTERATETPHASAHATWSGTPRASTARSRCRAIFRRVAPGGVRSDGFATPGASTATRPGGAPAGTDAPGATGAAPGPVTFSQPMRVSVAPPAPRSATTVSMPAPQSIVSATPSAAEIVSLPSPPEIASGPGPPTSRSAPAPPMSWSAPSPPRSVSLFSPPSSVSLPAPPSSESSPIPAVRKSLPSPPTRPLAPVLPEIVSSPEPPVTSSPAMLSPSPDAPSSAMPFIETETGSARPV